MTDTAATRAFLEAKRDDDFLGTSEMAPRAVQFGATLDLSEELSQRRALQVSLGLSDQAIDQVVALQDIIAAFAALYKREGRAMDSSLFETLYTESQKAEGAVTWRSYFNTIFKQQRELKNRIAACDNELKQIDSNVTHCEKQLKLLVASPTAQTQIGEERLIVQILNVEFNHTSDSISMEEHDMLFKVTLDCHGQFTSSAPRPLSDSQVFYNEMHAFSLPKADGDLELTVQAISAQAALGNDVGETLGTGIQPLSALADQLKHRLVVPFRGDKAEGSVVMTLQWIKSEVSFYERHIHHYAIQRNILLRDIHELQSKLDYLELTVLRKRRKFDKSSPLSMIVTAVKQPELVYSWAVNKVLVSAHASDYDKALQAVVGIALVFNCLTSFTRVLFLDSLAEGYAFWCNLDPGKRWTKNKFTKVIAALIGSIVFDMIWLFYNVRIFHSPDSDLSHLTTVLSILNILVKLLLIVFLCHARSRTQI